MSLFRRRLLMSQSSISTFPNIDGLIARYSARGLTNEQMSQTNIWKDLSGNGHDITLHNFAWGGMSGIGGYSQDFNRWGYGNLNNFTQTHSQDKIQLSLTSDRENIYSNVYDVSEAEYVLDFTVRITGLQQPCVIRVTKGGSSGDIMKITQDGIYNIKVTIEESWDQKRIYLFIDNRNGSPFDLTIEQVPLYPNALVSDGVDDYGICENFPILTKEKGYTICALVKHSADIAAGAYLLSKNPSNGQGEFSFMSKGSVDNAFGGLNYGQSIQSIIISDNFVYQNSNSFNGVAITKGSATQFNNELCLFRYRKNSGLFGKYALYDLLIYDRDLTEEEIGKIKTYFAKIHPDLSIN